VWYNGEVKLLCPSDAGNIPGREHNLIGGYAMENIPPHAQEGKPLIKKLLVFDGHKSDRINRRMNDGAPMGAYHQENATVIYGLVDPRDHRVFYIGLTNNLYLRFKQHILMTGDNERKQARIQAILDAHMLPWMLTLEVVDVDVDPREREIAYIQAYINAGIDLLNDEVEGA
jgi:hypothetical protein